MRVPELIDRGK